MNNSDCKHSLWMDYVVNLNHCISNHKIINDSSNAMKKMFWFFDVKL